MRDWLPASIILAIAADLGLFVAWAATAGAENCDNGIDRW
jgi:hypothetical protein